MTLRALVRVLKPPLERLGLDAHPWVSGTYSALARWRMRTTRTADGFELDWAGFRISLPHQNAVTAYQLNTRAYEAGTFDVLSRLVHNGDTIVDVGANVGVFSLYSARLVGSSGRVLAIEPLPVNLHHLRRNVSQNDAGCVTIVESAMGASSGRLTVRLSSVDTGSSSAVARSGAAVEVPMQTVDELVGHHCIRPTLVKIDTEGFEVSVLHGMKRTLTSVDPPTLLVEINHRMLALAGHTVRELLETVRPTHPYLYAVDETRGALQRIAAENPPRVVLYNLIASATDLSMVHPTVRDQH